MEKRYALVPAYLLHSFLYYHCDTSVISDDEFDWICRAIVESWDDCKSHRHASLLDLEALKAGSGYHIPLSKYPSIIINTAYKVVDDPAYWDRIVHGERLS